tara:strand:+ start:15220 stop:16050 length:831 start_codon:yes stop_codon:yes gene_type:complete
MLITDYSQFFIYLLNSINKVEFLTLLAAIATLLTAIATCWMVWEMRQGRIQTIKPQLILLTPSINYDFRWIPLESLQIIVRPEERASQKQTRLPIFQLKNIGSAPAQSIILEWSISDSQDVFTIILNSKILKPYKPEKNDEFISLTLENKHGKQSVGVPLRDNEIVKIPYSIASPTSEFSDPIIIPDGLFNNICFRFICEERLNYSLYGVQGSAITVKIKYYDLAGKRGESRFLITPWLDVTHDNVGSTTNSVDRNHRSESNLRGTLKFSVVPVTK